MSKNDAQATSGVTADPAFQQVMAAPPAGHGREAGCRCVADGITTSLTYGGATEARGASVGIEGIAEDAQHTDINITRKHYPVPSIGTSRGVAKQRTSAGEGGQPKGRGKWNR